MAKKIQKTSLQPADITRLISAMKVVFPTHEDVEKIVEEKIGEKTKFLPTKETLDQRLSELPTREEFDEKIRLLPTKEEFFSRMDKLSGEYKKIDEAETLHAGKLSEHTDEIEKHDARIKALESRLGSKPTPPLTP